MNQWNPDGTHLLSQETEYVLFSKALLDEHWYDISEQFASQYSMYHYNFGLHDLLEPTHHQNSVDIIIGLRNKKHRMLKNDNYYKFKI